MECSLAQVGANTAWTLIIASVVIAVGAATLVFSRRKAPALAMMVLAIGVVGAGAGAGTAAAGSAACEPVCFDIVAPEGFEGPPPNDLLLESDDGIHIQATMFASFDGSCTGSSSPVGDGAIAETEEEAEAICESAVVNLAASFPAGTSPVPATNVWGCQNDGPDAD